MKLTFVLHNHQPVGNFDYVLESAYKHAYEPFINSVFECEDFRFAIHFSGYLLNYIEKNHPDFIEKIKHLVSENRCEIIGGAMFEPILILLPEKDRNEQIKMMQSHIEKTFGITPKGFWLAERVWEQHVSKILSENGMEYTFLDDTHFLKSGKTEDELTGYFITEDEGYPLKIFPISKKLRYLIPFKEPSEIFSFLNNVNKENPDAILLLGDDGEKFGVWPGTYKYVYEERWLEKFLNSLTQNKETVKMVLPGEFAEENPPKGRVYLPESSYEEMLEWSNGNFRNFLIKYEESNNMNKKCLYLSEKTNTPPKELLMAEANDAYWHGVFGGLYLPHLRISIYENAIKAEKKIRPEIFSVKEKDINRDGEKETIVETPALNAYFTKKGGAMYELDFKNKNLNLLNVLTRRKEHYHKDIIEAEKEKSTSEVKTIHELKLAKSKDLDKFLIYDWYVRKSFIDHFFREDTTLQSVYQMKFGEQGDFVTEKFESKIEKDEKLLTAEFERDGHVWHGADWEEVHVSKRFLFEKDKNEFELIHTINANKELFLFHGLELNLMLFTDGMKINGKDYKDFLTMPGNRFEIFDYIQNLTFIIETSEAVELWTYPIYTVSQSESGFEKTFQGISFILTKKRIIKDEERTIKIKIE
ncbi:MAG: DUF1926 domain-containing protein [Caldisericaceae bacterium]|nr:DUF1926 domain-containing protein [Caldisericaceae bacterium]